MYKYAFTINSSYPSTTAEVYAWVCDWYLPRCRSMSSASVPEILKAARSFQLGRELTITSCDQLTLTLPPYVSVEEVQLLSEYVSCLQEQQRYYKEMIQLMERGATGDTSAAVEFCKKYKDQPLTDSAYG